MDQKLFFFAPAGGCKTPRPLATRVRRNDSFKEWNFFGSQIYCYKITRYPTFLKQCPKFADHRRGAKTAHPLGQAAEGSDPTLNTLRGPDLLGINQKHNGRTAHPP